MNAERKINFTSRIATGALAFTTLMHPDRAAAQPFCAPAELIQLFPGGKVEAGDKVLHLDLWNPASGKNSTILDKEGSVNLGDNVHGAGWVHQTLGCAQVGVDEHLARTPEEDRFIPVDHLAAEGYLPRETAPSLIPAGREVAPPLVLRDEPKAENVGNFPPDPEHKLEDPVFDSRNGYMILTAWDSKNNRHYVTILDRKMRVVKNDVAGSTGWKYPESSNLEQVGKDTQTLIQGTPEDEKYVDPLELMKMGLFRNVGEPAPLTINQAIAQVCGPARVVGPFGYDPESKNPNSLVETKEGERALLALWDPRKSNLQRVGIVGSRTLTSILDGAGVAFVYPTGCSEDVVQKDADAYKLKNIGQTFPDTYTSDQLVERGYIATVRR